MEIKKPIKYDEEKKIKIIAPASPIKTDFLRRGINRVKDFFPDFEYSDVIFSKYFFMAGNDDERAKDLNYALNEFDFVWCGRGGYGSLRLLDKIFFKRDGFPIFMGSSDITSLLLFLTQKYNFITFYGPMVAGELADGKKNFDLFLLRDVLSGKKGKGTVLSEKKMDVIVSGNLEGEVTGGCLTLVVSSLGTLYEIDTEDKILFLEDVNSKPYEIDRMLMQLKYGGKLDECQGIIFGEMVNCIQNENQGYTLQEVIYENLKGLKKPVYFGFPCGHTLKGGTFLPIGGRIKVIDGQIILDERVVC